MEPLGTSGTLSAPPITRVIWDLTYACPLRCTHCYSESGRRAARMLDRQHMRRVAQVIIAVRPERVSFSGGEPLLSPWCTEAARLLSEAGTALRPGGARRWPCRPFISSFRCSTRR